MDLSSFGFDKNIFLFFLISPNGFDTSVFGLIVLGWAIFWLVWYDNFRHCRGVFDSNVLNICILILLVFLGFGIGFLYQGIFEFWLMAVFSLMIFLALIDIKKFAVPDWLNFALLFLVILGVMIFDNSFYLSFEKLLEGFGLAGLFAIFRIFGDMIYKKEILGEGDIVFIASSGLLFGTENSLKGIFWGCVLGIFYILFSRLFGKSVFKIPLIAFILFGIIFCFIIRVYSD
ncbi:prepilin peptidase [Helicobacter sp. 13S00477-4]|uniref:prepilin peptidase n=1 Tax=Helicobacter sp. 13S00477-4 TaxID=1905759 RepID=UPI000BA59596|nr:prepilin peptidase [Helicobacter sp. 13S00477-4]PAF51555.1 hypothetical protein BKH44_05805 [Helicobacter sp. 13S00477-4]